MSAEDLIQMLEEVEKRQNTEPRSCLNLLQLVAKFKQTIAVIDKT